MGEYYGRHTPYGQVPRPFARFLQKNGIVAQYSTSGEPQQNRVAERRNRTLIDMVRSMISYFTNKSMDGDVKNRHSYSQ